MQDFNQLNIPSLDVFPKNQLKIHVKLPFSNFQEQKQEKPCCEDHPRQKVVSNPIYKPWNGRNPIRALTITILAYYFLPVLVWSSEWMVICEKISSVLNSVPPVDSVESAFWVYWLISGPLIATRVGSKKLDEMKYLRNQKKFSWETSELRSFNLCSLLLIYTPSSVRYQPPEKSLCISHKMRLAFILILSSYDTRTTAPEFHVFLQQKIVSYQPPKPFCFLTRFWAQAFESCAGCSEQNKQSRPFLRTGFPCVVASLSRTKSWKKNWKSWTWPGIRKTIPRNQVKLTT